MSKIDIFIVIVSICLLGYTQTVKDERIASKTEYEKYEFLYENNGTSDDLKYKKWVINHHAKLKIESLNIQRDLEIKNLKEQ